MYAKFIDSARRIIAAVFALSALGMLLSAIVKSPEWFEAFVVIAAASLVAVFGVVAELLVRSYLEARATGMQKYQFSLLEMLVVTTVFAALLSCYKIIGTELLCLLVPFLLFVGCVVEVCRLLSHKSADKATSDHEAVPGDTPAADQDYSAVPQRKNQ